MLVNGKIIKINSDTFTVKIDDEEVSCKLRGKFRLKLMPLVGDNVRVNKNDKVIEEILPRHNSLDRPKVANIDMALIVTSIKEPNLSLNLLDKLISIIIINKIEPVVILTKLDLVDNTERKALKNLFNYYEKLNIKVFTNEDIKKIKKYIKNKTVTVCGQTGAGKSTLINKLKQDLNLKTDTISKSLGRGKHTTRIVELYQIDDFYIVDTPGFSKIDINIYSKEEIRNSFREFQKYPCKFKDCTHENSSSCAVIKNVLNNNILKSRYDNYLRFIKE